MNYMALIDGPSAAIVFGGTALGTVLRCGLGEVRATVRALALLGVPRFDAKRARSRLAAQVLEIQRDGLLRAHPVHFGDSELDEATDALLTKRSLAALVERHESHKARRLAQSEAAVRTLSHAADLGPVFGLAGTLISLSQLPSGGVVAAGLTGAIAMAVLTTLYGLLAANLVLAPLARIVERAAQAEETARQQVIDWLAGQVAQVCQLEPVPARAAA